ncbi:hypothetical protein [Streptomyces hokutonensis]|uniref:Uncharacterized protein n=1 Tax=Streptomyces hokutonensis TaxID=1306990 RepID=A0ABW6M442_9ACTN
MTGQPHPNLHQTQLGIQVSRLGMRLRGPNAPDEFVDRLERTVQVRLGLPRRNQRWQA